MDGGTGTVKQQPRRCLAPPTTLLPGIGCACRVRYPGPCICLGYWVVLGILLGIPFLPFPFLSESNRFIKCDRIHGLSPSLPNAEFEYSSPVFFGRLFPRRWGGNVDSKVVGGKVPRRG